MEVPDKGGEAKGVDGPAKPLDFDLARSDQIKAEYFDKSISVACSRAEAKSSPSAFVPGLSFPDPTMKTLKQFVPGAYALRVFSPAFCAMVSDKFFASTTLAQRQEKGVDMCNAFYSFGDAMAKALSVYLPRLAEDAETWLNNAAIHQAQKYSQTRIYT